MSGCGMFAMYDIFHWTLGYIHPLHGQFLELWTRQVTA
jgi:hypothetical protein